MHQFEVQFACRVLIGKPVGLCPQVSGSLGFDGCNKHMPIATSYSIHWPLPVATHVVDSHIRVVQLLRATPANDTSKITAASVVTVNTENRAIVSSSGNKLRVRTDRNVEHPPTVYRHQSETLNGRSIFSADNKVSHNCHEKQHGVQ